jgi:hypothetical protein
MDGSYDAQMADVESFSVPSLVKGKGKAINAYEDDNLPW